MRLETTKIEAKMLRRLKMLLFSGQQGRVFTILDGASVPSLPQQLASFAPEQACLHRGELAPDIAQVAPYLAILEADSPFTDWVLTNGWGKHWGIFGTSRADLASLRTHFRKFVIVYDENGKSLYFRYYDPRVLRLYLPMCQPDELNSVFGPVAYYLIEDQEPTSCRRFLYLGGSLHQESENILTE